MNSLKLIFPKDTETDPLEVIQSRTHNRIRPFAVEVIDFFDELSRDLFQMSREDPALAPLAFFIRRGNLQSLAESVKDRAPNKSVLVPQGTVLHIPPTNVDTLFLYSLSITLLAGNSNLVRISRNAGPATFGIVEVILRRLERHPVVSELVTILSFDRDQDVLDTISSWCDFRMTWGGDAAISAIRRSPLQPHAKELTFPDRVSFAALSATAWAGASEEARLSVIEGLYNDTFWFDQMACSSPVHIALVGGTPEEASLVAAELTLGLAEQASRRYADVDGQAINKMVDVLRGLERGLSDMHWRSNSVVTLDGAELVDASSVRPGGGFFTTQHLESLAEITPQLQRQIQTLSVFGFSSDELTSFAELANGLGIDRIVPIGNALDFSSVWDGKDLLLESLRYVTIDV